MEGCISAVSFYALGFGFAFGRSNSNNGFIGTGSFMLLSEGDDENYAKWMFQWAFCAVSSTIASKFFGLGLVRFIKCQI